MDQKDDDKKPQPPQQPSRQRSEKRGHFNQPERPINPNPQGNQEDNNQVAVEQNDPPPVNRENPPVDLNRQPVGEGNESSDEKALNYLQELVSEVTTQFDLTPIRIPWNDERNLRIDQNKPSEKEGSLFGKDRTQRPKPTPNRNIKIGAGRKDDLSFLNVEGVEHSPRSGGKYGQIVEDPEIRLPPTQENLKNLAELWKKIPNLKLQGVNKLLTNWTKTLPKDIKQLEGKELNNFVNETLLVLAGINQNQQKEKELGKEERKLLQQTKQMLRDAILEDRNDLQKLDDCLQNLEPTNRIFLANDMMDELRENPKASLSPVQKKCFETSLVDGGKEKFAQQLGKMLTCIKDHKNQEEMIMKGFKLFVGSDKDEDTQSNLEFVYDLSSKIKATNGSVSPTLRGITCEFVSEIERKDPEKFDHLLIAIKPEAKISMSDETLEEVKQRPEKKITLSQAKRLAMGLLDVPQQQRARCLNKLREHFKDDKLVAKIAITGLEVFGTEKLQSQKGIDLANGTMEFPEVQFQIAKLAIKDFTREMNPGTGFNRATAFPKPRFLNSCGYQNPEMRQVLLTPLKDLLKQTKKECEQIDKALNSKDPKKKEKGHQDIIAQVKILAPKFLESMGQMKLPEQVLRILGEAYSSVENKVNRENKLPPPENIDPNKKSLSWKTGEVEAQKAMGGIFCLGVLNPLLMDAYANKGLVPEMGDLSPSVAGILKGLSQVIQGMGTQKDTKSDVTSVGGSYGDLFKDHVEPFTKVMSGFGKTGMTLLPKPEIEEEIEFAPEESNEDSPHEPPTNQQKNREPIIKEDPEDEDEEPAKKLTKNLAGVFQEIPNNMISDEDKKALLGEKNEAFYSALEVVWQQIVTKLEHDQDSKDEKDAVDFAFDRLGELLEPLVMQRREIPPPPEKSESLDK